MEFLCSSMVIGNDGIFALLILVRLYIYIYIVKVILVEDECLRRNMKFIAIKY